MNVVAFLPPRLLRHLEFVLGRERSLHSVKSWKELEDVLRSSAVSVAVIDPSADGSSNSNGFARLLAKYPSLPIIAYVPFTPQAFRAIAELSRVGLENVILHPHDDSAERLLATLDKVSASPLTSRLIRGLQPWLTKLPIALVKVVKDMFAEPHCYINARDIAISAKVPTVRLYRCFYAAGLAPPRNLLIAAKVLRGYRYLADPGNSVAMVSKKLGYHHPRIFAGHTTEVFGCNPSRMCAHMTDSDVIERILRWVNLKEDAAATMRPRYRSPVV